MATVKWRDTKKLKPEVLLNKINSIKVTFDDGRISYEGFTYHNCVAAIATMLQFPKGLPDGDKFSLLHDAVNNVSKKGQLTPGDLLEELVILYQEAMKSKEEEYRMLLSISLEPPYVKKVLRLEGVKIRILSGGYPKKYEGREAQVEKYGGGIQAEPSSYAKVIASTKERTRGRAVEKILRALDIFRAIYCLFVNPRMQLMGKPWEPVNRIRFGSIYTLHKKTGKIVKDGISYDPNFVVSKTHRTRDLENLKNNFEWTVNQLQNCAYTSIVCRSMLQYVRALDEKDPNTALIKLWSALECIAAPNQASYEKIIHRCSFMFKDRDYHKQILEHIRMSRNLSVHSGERMDKSKTLCFQLQYYFFHMILFHLSFSGDFECHREANSFLDLSPSLADLKRKKALLERAINYVSN